jgi:hypothetical protein
MLACHQALQSIDIIESPIQLNQCRNSIEFFKTSSEKSYSPCRLMCCQATTDPFLIEDSVVP